MTQRLLTVSIRNEVDVVGARQRARQIAELCGFGRQEQVRIATTVSELARNVFRYVGNGHVDFAIEGSTLPQTLLIQVRDKGPGIANLDEILAGHYHSSTGMGLGLLGARKLMDAFEVRTGAGLGTTITLRKLLPGSAQLITPLVASQVGGSLASATVDVALSEAQQQNQELLSTLAELKNRQEELVQLTRELEDTNRGVVALYAELDEKADHLRRADQAKSRFLSNMSHEFRTPLSSIRALAKLLLDRVDGELGVEQEKQVRFILDSASALTDLVNDLLDLAKIEAGKVEVRTAPFQVSDMFSALRGMLRPLLVSDRLQLSFVAPEHCEMTSDEGKVAQILRNFISNAIKFTEHGSITVTAEVMPATAAGASAIRFSVTDTGIGISADQQAIIFEEFSQVENHLQQHVKGTGLGLPLCRQLATLLRGEVSVSSRPGFGSTFSALLPMVHCAASSPREELAAVAADDPRLPVLVIEDRPELRLLYERYLHQSEFRMLPAQSLAEAETLWRHIEPRAVLLDILLNGKDSWHWLVQIKNDAARRQIPVIIASDVNDKGKAMGLGADAYFLKPMSRDELLAALRSLTGGESTRNEMPARAVNG